LTWPSHPYVENFTTELVSAGRGTVDEKGNIYVAHAERPALAEVELSEQSFAELNPKP
jgi:hypothetical protein